MPFLLNNTMLISLPFLITPLLLLFLFTFIHPTNSTQQQQRLSSKVKCLTYPNKTTDSSVISVLHDEPFFISCRINQKQFIKKQKWHEMVMDMKTFNCVLNHREPRTKKLTACTATPPEDGTPCPNSKYRITFQKYYHEDNQFSCTLSVPHSTQEDNGTWTLSFLSFENGLFVSLMYLCFVLFTSQIFSFCFSFIYALYFRQKK